MDVILMILYASIVLGVLVVIHEGGHYLASRAFGVRVSEFMVGLPGPGIGIKRGETRFGVTCIPLGGYARVCGMEPGEESPHLAGALESVYRRGTCNMEDVAADLGIEPDDAYEALEELVEWGSITGPRKTDKFNTFRTPEFVEVKPSRRARKLRAQALARRSTRQAASDTGIHARITPASLPGAALSQAEIFGDVSKVKRKGGEPRPVADAQAFYEYERAQTYRSLPFWKRSLILLAGPGVNILFTILVFLIVYSIIGIDYVNEAGAVEHVVVSPLRALAVGFNYIGMVVVAILGLFNPQTAAQTVSDSTSIVGIAVLSKTAAEQGLLSFTMFSAMLSVSLGLMNMLPIPPLDGGRFLVEVYQKIRRKAISPRALNSLSIAGVTLFTLFFLVMLNQDIQRFVFGNW